MPITLNDLTVNFAHIDRATLLADWQWLIGSSKLPILVTAMGTAFLQDTQDGTVWALDPGEGKMHEVAKSGSEFESLLSEREFVFSALFVEDFVAITGEGQSLAPGQVYGYIQPPVLGGGFNTENLVPTDMQVHFSLSGQIHRQVKDLPDGSPITGVSLA